MYYNYNGLNILEDAISPYSFIKKLNIFLIRHGESECNKLQDFYKSQNQPLTEDLKMEDSLIKLTKLGKEQAQNLGINLNNYINANQISKNNSLILVSPYKRARETFEISNEYLKFNINSNNIYVLNSLAEQFFGAFNMISNDVKKEVYGKIFEECNKITTKYFKPTFLGESPFDVCNRLWNAIFFIKDYLEENPKTQNVFVFGHGNANKCMLMNLLNLPPEFFGEFPKVPNSSILNINHGRFFNLQI